MFPADRGFDFPKLAACASFPGVRVPIPLVILLCVSVIGGFWWNGTRHMDFLTPPSEARLAEIRSKVEASLPPADHPVDAVSAPIPQPAPPPPPMEEPKPEIDPGDLECKPTLREYVDRAPQGAAHFIELAALLETKGEFQRALLAWERAIDSGKPDENQTAAAISAIKRLRPTLPDWNTDPAKTIAITLQAGTGKKTAKTLKPILEETARELSRASAGILKVTVQITAGRDSKKAASGPAPVALWLAGPAKKARSTEVLSFTVGPPDTLREEVRKTVFQILRGYLGRKSGQCPPPAIPDGQPALDAFNSHITRLYWHELGTMLGHPPEKSQ